MNLIFYLSKPIVKILPAVLCTLLLNTKVSGQTGLYIGVQSFFSYDLVTIKPDNAPLVFISDMKTSHGLSFDWRLNNRFHLGSGLSYKKYRASFQFEYPHPFTEETIHMPHLWTINVPVKFGFTINSNFHQLQIVPVIGYRLGMVLNKNNGSISQKTIGSNTIDEGVQYEPVVFNFDVNKTSFINQLGYGIDFRIGAVAKMHAVANFTYYHGLTDLIHSTATSTGSAELNQKVISRGSSFQMGMSIGYRIME